MRLLTLLVKVKNKSSDGEALLVTHGGIIRMMTFLETGIKKAVIDNATLLEFDVDKILNSDR